MNHMTILLTPGQHCTSCLHYPKSEEHYCTLHTWLVYNYKCTPPPSQQNDQLVLTVENSGLHPCDFPYTREIITSYASLFLQNLWGPLVKDTTFRKHNKFLLLTWQLVICDFIVFFFSPQCVFCFVCMAYNLLHESVWYTDLIFSIVLYPVHKFRLEKSV